MAISTIGVASSATPSPGSPSGMALVSGGYSSQGFFQLPPLKIGTYNLMASQATNTVRAAIGSQYITPNALGGTTTFSVTSETFGSLVYGGWSTSTAPAQPRTITFINNLFWLGVSNGFYSSTDAVTWTYRGAFGKSADCTGIAYNGTNLYVAAGNNGTSSTFWSVSTSIDGSSWTQQSAPDAGYGLTYGNGVFVLLGGTSGIWTSTNGTSWTNRGASASLYHVAHNGLSGSSSLFVAVGSSGQCYTSVDGITWAFRTTVGTGNGLWQVAYGNGLWITVGAQGVVNTSPDGITWTQRTITALGTSVLSGVVYGNGTWVILGNNGLVVTSTDGITWSSRATNGFFPTSYGQYGGQGMAFGNGRFVSAATTIGQSPDAIKGKAVTFSLFSDAYATLN
jgi:hypothetical protein